MNAQLPAPAAAHPIAPADQFSTDPVASFAPLGTADLTSPVRKVPTTSNCTLQMEICP
jgi:hypothetical protein